MVELAVIDDDLYLEHEASREHPERPERLEAARRGLGDAGANCNLLAGRAASFEELALVHTPEHLQRLAQCAGRAGWLDPDTFYSEMSYQAALHAAGSGLQLIDAMRAGADFGVALVRPPGHHACPDRAMGFCLLNNVAVAAAQLKSQGAERIVIFDWDVHHGNGTQDIFYEDDSVLYISTHQSPQYPGTGAVEETGRGAGRGYTVNIPLPAGSGDAVYEAAMARVVCPIIEQFSPEWTLVSAGYDAHYRDPLGGMELTGNGFGSLTTLLTSVLPSNGRGRTLFLLEGGYDLMGIEEGVFSTVRALSEPQSAATQSSLASEQERALQQALEVQGRYWTLKT